MLFKAVHKQTPILGQRLRLCFCLMFFCIALVGQIFYRVSVPQKAYASAFITRSGTKLYLAGSPYNFTGMNAFSLGTVNGGNVGCGPMFSDTQLQTFFGSLPPFSMVRTWAYQGTILTDMTSKQINFSYLDRVVAAATQHNIRLVLAIADQYGTCDDNRFKDAAWYTTNYRMAFNNATGTTPLSYWAFLNILVPHYANNPTVAIWEPLNEPQSANCVNVNLGPGCIQSANNSCPTNATVALRTFFDTVGGQIKQLDPNHLVSSGVIGSGQCGASGTAYTTVHQSPGIDIGSYHDYGNDTVAVPGDAYNGMQVRINQLSSINKPLMVGEAGIQAATSGNCNTLGQRASLFSNKLQGQFRAGIVGFMIWNFYAPTSSGCAYDVGYNDPVFAVMAPYNYALPGVPGDCDSDGHVTITDLSTLLSHFSTNYPACDFDKDGTVSILDMSTLLSWFGT